MPSLAESAFMSQELGLALRRNFWKPLRNMMDIFHVLPLAAVVIIFVLLATDGQFRELYISYLEGPQVSHGSDVPTLGAWVLWVVSMAAALLLIALISAVLFEAHYALSTMRLNIVYSSYSNPDANSLMRRLQKGAAFILAFLPWLALAIGLFNARDFVASRYCQLLTLLQHNNITGQELYNMEHLWLPSGWTIAGALVALGGATGYFSAVSEHSRNALRAVACCTPTLAVLLFVLLTDWFDFSQFATLQTAVLGSIIVGATAVYFWLYQKLYNKRGAFFFSGSGVSLRKRRRVRFALWAFLPWLSFAAYFVWVQQHATPVRPGMPWSQCPVAASPIPEPGYWAAFPVAMCYTIAIGLLIGHLLGRFSDHVYRRHVVMALVGAFALFALAVACLNVSYAVAVYRFIGPLGTVTLQLLLLISTFAFLAALSQRSGFPLLTLVVLALIVALMFPRHLEATAWALGIVCILVAAMALVSRRVVIAGMVMVLPVVLGVDACEFTHLKPVAQNASRPVAENERVKYEFSCWLNQRGVAAGDKAVAQDPACVRDPSSATGRDEWPAGVKYPVFIVAAEGGGIYASSAASMFLARLTDAVSKFDDHVFAVSGVSGGSIGAAIFQALDHAEHQDSSTNNGGSAGEVAAAGYAQQPACPDYPPMTPDSVTQKLENKARNIMEDDHFSPVIGSVFTEFFGLPLNRPDALVASFENSTAAQDDKAGRNLCAPFRDHWKAADSAPALALNSTWVETGFRVAFAPFALNDLDESLYSFADSSMPDEECRNNTDGQPCVSLMQAAGVSARFPLIMPPFSVMMSSAGSSAHVSNASPGNATAPSGGSGATNNAVPPSAGAGPTGGPPTKQKSSQKRWNFVDGAYSDNSGATTALDIYKAVEKIAPESVDLRLILITSSIPQPNLAGTDINGTVFRDTIAPLDALMKVREDLGNDAVARACTYVYHDDPMTPSASTGGPQGGAAKSAANGKRQPESNEDCIEHAGGLKSPLNIVEIQDQTYGLSLGWKISKTSFDVVAWMLGEPRKCPSRDEQSTIVSKPEQQSAPTTEDNINAQLSDDILERNSCVLRTIVELVDGRLPSPVPEAQQKPTQ
jgi:hypothetical protein